jgi:hypothetical protein
MGGKPFRRGNHRASLSSDEELNNFDDRRKKRN